MNANLPSTGRRQCQSNYRVWILAALAVALAACGGGGGSGGGSNGDDTPATASVSVAIDLDAAASGLQALAATPDDVASITVDVADGETELVSAFALAFSEGTWSGTISDLPAGVMLTFTAHAYEGTPTEIFSGVAQASLTAEGPNNVSIDLAPVDDGELNLPRIVSIAVPSEITVNSSVTVLIDLEGSADETLDWTLTAETDGGSFDPASGSLPLSSGGTGTLSVTYTAPATDGSYTHTISVTNSAGNAVEAEFSTVVVIAIAEGGLSVRFPPVVTAITAKWAPELWTVTWTAAAVGDGSCCGYTWSSAFGDGYSAFRDPPTSNPAILDYYPGADTGTVSVQVSDGTGLASTSTVTVPAGQFPEVQVVSDVWTQRAALPTRRIFAGSGGVNGVVYVIGGIEYPDGITGEEVYSDTVEAYDPATDTWSPKASMPTPRIASSSVVNGIIYSIGGPDFGNAVEAYDPASDTWSTKASMPTARNRFTTAAVDGIVYAIGGKTSTVASSEVAIVEAYDPVADSWTSKTSMPTARTDLSSAVVNGIIYAIGGSQNDGAGTAGRKVEAYDPVTDTWSTKASLPIDFLRPTSVALGGLIYATNGNSLYVYEPNADTWTALTGLGGTGFGFIRPLTSVAVNGLMYIFGGNDFSFSQPMRSWAYTP